MKEDSAGMIQENLEEREKEERNIPVLLEFYHKLVQLQTGANERVLIPAPGLDREAIRALINKGLPLVGIADLTLDWPLIEDIFAQVVTLFAGYPQLFGETAGRLKEPGTGRVLTTKAVEAWFAGKDLPSTLQAGVSKNLMTAVIQATLLPFLAKYSGALYGSIEQERWRRGYCPICGGSPDLASLKGEVGERWLLCSRCDTEWLFQRMECPYCGTQEQNDLVFFTDAQEQYRLYVCERCKCYLKAVDLRKVEAGAPLPFERLYTIDLDRQAVGKGYHACRGPAMKKAG